MGFLAPRALDEATLQENLDEIVEMLRGTSPFYLDRTGGSLEKRAKGIGLPMADLITDKYPLEEINEALKKNLEMTGLKIAVVNK